ncbi:hypothetical protein, partial [Tritonibacter sp. SIMBA_163]|uniref:hypothetical protein n=1 Tax=Tritonibacter sp. SIMBA_163 TaxID=3080868 RepID=UPI0039814AF4
LFPPLLQVMRSRIFFAFVICWPGTIVINQGNIGGIKYQPAAEHSDPASVAENRNLRAVGMMG